MAITYPLAFPDERKVALVQLQQVSTVAESLSTFDGTAQVYPFDGEWWEATITLPPMRARDAYTWAGWLAALNGKQGTFLLGDPARLGPYGAAGSNPGTPLVNGAGQTGKTLAIDGCPVSITGYLLRGDFIGVGSGAAQRLHMVTQDANTSALGAVTLDIWPRLRVSPADNAAITLAAPKTRFGLADNRRSWSVEPGLIVQGIQIMAKERLDGT